MFSNVVKLSFALGILATASVAALPRQAVPKKTAVIKIDLMEGKKDAVSFEHKKHAEVYQKRGGKAILCRDCHHTIKVDRPKATEVKACSSCHATEGKTQKVHANKKVPFLAVHKKPGLWDSKSILLHKNCIPCHKAMKAPLKAAGKKSIHMCKTCHVKK